MIKKVVAMYFSPTGTTKKTVETIASHISRRRNAKYEVMDFTLPEARKKPYFFEKNTLVVLGVPVIAGRVPNLLLPFLRTVMGQGAYGMPIVLFGNRNFDDALMELKILLEENHFFITAAGAFVGEHSFSTVLAKGRPDREDQEEMKAFAEKVVEKTLKEPPTDYFKVDGNNPIGPYYMPKDRKGNPIDIRKVKPKTDLHICENCGVCVQVCPLGSVEKKDVTRVGLCMKCCACIKKCPKGAKYFDDQGYLYHKKELEIMYGSQRKENHIFL